MESFIPTLPQLALLVPLLIFGALSYRIIYTQYFHPLSKFSGPWYLTSFSLTLALISTTQREPEYLMYLTHKYGSKFTTLSLHYSRQTFLLTYPLPASKPIRISPTMLLFPRASALRDIYRDPACNLKARLYGSGVLGPPHLFSTLDGDSHRELRRALANAPWTIGPLKKAWESRFDSLIELFTANMREHAEAQRRVCLSDKVAEFAADVMSIISFTEPFGCVQSQTDVRDILKNWRLGLTFFGLAGRWRWLRDVVLQLPVVGLWLLPKASNESGMGWLMCEADRQVTGREGRNAEMEKGSAEERVGGERKDFLQQYVLSQQLTLRPTVEKVTC